MLALQLKWEELHFHGARDVSKDQAETNLSAHMCHISLLDLTRAVRMKEQLGVPLIWE